MGQCIKAQMKLTVPHNLYLNNNHIPHLYVTNNSTKTPVQLTEKLREMHIDAKPDEVVTSALATADYISEQHPNATVYMIGGHGLKTAN